MQPQAFDSYALQYDAHFTHSLIGTEQRKQVYSHLSKFLPSVKTALEVNCGTGEDATWFANQGIQVTATDISEGMLGVAQKKNKNGSVQFQLLKSQEIDRLSPAHYNLVFSNFGGLNCLNKPELKEFKNGCAALQKKSDLVALVIMSEKCVWERVYFRIKKNKANASRRANAEGADTVIDGVRFKTYYYSPGYMKELFSEHYTTLLVKPIGLFVPPSYMGGYFNNHSFLFSILKNLDSLFARFRFLANYADHFLIILQKK